MLTIEMTLPDHHVTVHVAAPVDHMIEIVYRPCLYCGILTHHEKFCSANHRKAYCVKRIGQTVTAMRYPKATAT